MSNYLAVAAATTAIKQLLDYGLRNEGLSGISVTAKPPDSIDRSTNSLNIFLYQLSRNTAYENYDLPLRNSEGEFVNSPIVALDLNYMITAYSSNDDDLYSQMILASAIQTLHENSVLTQAMIPIIINTNSGMVESNVDLAQQPESVKITPQNLSFEEVTKLWSSFFQTGYRLSVFYKATVILLSREKNLRSSLPVKEIGAYGFTMKRPIIEEISPSILDLTSKKLTLIGRNLNNQIVDIKLDGEIIDPANMTSKRSTQIEFKLPADIAAGLKQIQVIQSFNIGNPPVPHKGFDSNVSLFYLAPLVTKNDLVTPLDSIDVNSGNAMTLFFQPDLREGQKISILFNDEEIISESIGLFSWDDVPDTDTTKFRLFLSVNFDEVKSWISDATITKLNNTTINVMSSDGTSWLSIVIDMAAKTAKLTITTSAGTTDYILSVKQENSKINIYRFLNSIQFTVSSSIPLGNYLLRLRVDGVNSILSSDNNGKFAGPVVRVL